MIIPDIMIHPIIRAMPYAVRLAYIVIRFVICFVICLVVRFVICLMVGFVVGAIICPIPAALSTT
ncbi:hypothetical protein ACU5P1_14150 [Pseudomonas plecoglossicida]|uniref:hypothetical protein n=1 Tax=Pseudomonas plecoglossicida TaxID=70775 RepID=UPI00039F31E5|nr:hypothetical protein [Pseudomonas plecoglossicida]QLB55854.1 hypothetical protein HAV28_13995 [Pseudomonas plecoglossicida]